MRSTIDEYGITDVNPFFIGAGGFLDQLSMQRTTPVRHRVERPDLLRVEALLLEILAHLFERTQRQIASARTGTMIMIGRMKYVVRQVRQARRTVRARSARHFSANGLSSRAHRFAQVARPSSA